MSKPQFKVAPRVMTDDKGAWSVGFDLYFNGTKVENVANVQLEATWSHDSFGKAQLTISLDEDVEVEAVAKG